MSSSAAFLIGLPGINMEQQIQIDSRLANRIGTGLLGVFLGVAATEMQNGMKKAMNNKMQFCNRNGGNPPKAYPENNAAENPKEQTPDNNVNSVFRSNEKPLLGIFNIMTAVNNAAGKRK